MHCFLKTLLNLLLMHAQSRSLHMLARYLNDHQMEKTLRKIIAKSEDRMERYTSELEALHDKWSKCFVDEQDLESDSSSDGFLKGTCFSSE